MDEATVQAFKGVEQEVSGVRGAVRGLHKEFVEHVSEDRKAFAQIWKVINFWSGQLTILKWMGAAIGGAVVAHVFRHWN